MPPSNNPHRNRSYSNKSLTNTSFRLNDLAPSSAAGEQHQNNPSGSTSTRQQLGVHFTSTNQQGRSHNTSRGGTPVNAVIGSGPHSGHGTGGTTTPSNHHHHRRNNRRRPKLDATKINKKYGVAGAPSANNNRSTTPVNEGSSSNGKKRSSVSIPRPRSSQQLGGSLRGSSGRVPTPTTPQPPAVAANGSRASMKAIGHLIVSAIERIITDGRRRRNRCNVECKECLAAKRNVPGSAAGSPLPQGAASFTGSPSLAASPSIGPVAAPPGVCVTPAFGASGSNPLHGGFLPRPLDRHEIGVPMASVSDSCNTTPQASPSNAASPALDPINAADRIIIETSSSTKAFATPKLAPMADPLASSGHGLGLFGRSPGISPMKYEGFMNQPLFQLVGTNETHQHSHPSAGNTVFNVSASGGGNNAAASSSNRPETFTPQKKEDLLKFILDIHRRVRMKESGPIVFIAAMIYLVRITRNCTCEHGQIDYDNYYRLSVSAILVASKLYLEEGVCAKRFNKYFADAANLTLEEMRAMEVEFLHLVDFHILIEESDFVEYCAWLEDIADLSFGASGSAPLTPSFQPQQHGGGDIVGKWVLNENGDFLPGTPVMLGAAMNSVDGQPSPPVSPVILGSSPRLTSPTGPPGSGGQQQPPQPGSNKLQSPLPMPTLPSFDNMSDIISPPVGIPGANASQSEQLGESFRNVIRQSYNDMGSGAPMLRSPSHLPATGIQPPVKVPSSNSLATTPKSFGHYLPPPMVSTSASVSVDPVISSQQPPGSGKLFSQKFVDDADNGGNDGWDEMPPPMFLDDSDDCLSPPPLPSSVPFNSSSRRKNVAELRRELSDYGGEDRLHFIIDESRKEMDPPKPPPGMRDFANRSTSTTDRERQPSGGVAPTNGLTGSLSRGPAGGSTSAFSDAFDSLASSRGRQYPPRMGAHSPPEGPPGPGGFSLTETTTNGRSGPLATRSAWHDDRDDMDMPPPPPMTRPTAMSRREDQQTIDIDSIMNHRQKYQQQSSTTTTTTAKVQITGGSHSGSSNHSHDNIDRSPVPGLGGSGSTSSDTMGRSTPATQPSSTTKATTSTSRPTTQTTATCGGGGGGVGIYARSFMCGGGDDLTDDEEEEMWARRGARMQQRRLSM